MHEDAERGDLLLPCWPGLHEMSLRFALPNSPDLILRVVVVVVLIILFFDIVINTVRLRISATVKGRSRRVLESGRRR